ncbi:MAG: hypothetical protein M3Z54_05775 [Gemmatimonadota bacterium]|nr:hypothetical protein [Gemmatimonadota bacterium]
MKHRTLAVAAIALVTGCVQHDPLYDGEPATPLVTSGDITTLIPLTIQNNRVDDAIDPTFYLAGTGRHSLGVVKGMGGKRIQFVDTKWFGSDNCFTVVAHYSGGGDYTFDRTCWRPGYVVEISLESIYSTSSAWAHR